MADLQKDTPRKSTIEYFYVRNSPTGPIVQVIVTEPDRRLHVMPLTSEMVKRLVERLNELDFEP